MGEERWKGVEWTRGKGFLLSALLLYRAFSPFAPFFLLLLASSHFISLHLTS